MANWLFDEDINKPAVEKFRRAGINGKHIKYDLNISGRGDEEVLQIARKEKATLITANTSDFISIKNSVLQNSPGVWIFYSQDYEEQVELLKIAYKITGFDTLARRKEKKVIIHKDSVVIIDCRSNKVKEIRYSEYFKKLSKKK